MLTNYPCKVISSAKWLLISIHVFLRKAHSEACEICYIMGRKKKKKSRIQWFSSPEKCLCWEEFLLTLLRWVLQVFFSILIFFHEIIFKYLGFFQVVFFIDDTLTWKSRHVLIWFYRKFYLLGYLSNIITVSWDVMVNIKNWQHREGQQTNIYIYLCITIKHEICIKISCTRQICS